MSICAAPTPTRLPPGTPKMFGAEVIRSVMSNGIERTDIRLAGVNHFIAKVPETRRAGAEAGEQLCRARPYRAPGQRHRRVCAELKAKGAEFTVEPKTIRPGVRIAFVRGPQNVLIEIARPRCDLRGKKLAEKSTPTCAGGEENEATPPLLLPCPRAPAPGRNPDPWPSGSRSTSSITAIAALSP